MGNIVKRLLGYNEGWLEHWWMERVNLTDIWGRRLMRDNMGLIIGLGINRDWA